MGNVIPACVYIYVLEVEFPQAEIESWTKLLDKSEKKRLSRISSDPVRTGFIASRMLLRRKLAEYLQTDPESLQFQLLSGGKPVLDPRSAEFNFSHSRQRIALAITDKVPLGIDIEYIKRKNQIYRIAHRYFSADECEQLHNAVNKRDLFFNFWTLKEAYAKALGVGLRKGLKTFGYDIGHNINLWDKDNDVEQTSFFSYRLPDDYHLSLCVLQKNAPRPRLVSVDMELNETVLEPLWYLTS